MASSSAKKLQSKLFNSLQTSGSPTPGAGTLPITVEGLSIHIPKPPPVSGNQMLIIPKVTKAADGSPQENGVAEEEEYRSYRERVLDKLGDDYEGVERYRLKQDGKRERHWKRWGPYVSERQWVSGHSILQISFITFW